MKHYYIVFLILLNFLGLRAQRSCPIGWILNERYGFCYKIGVADLARNWYQARVACQSFSAELASIKDAGERESLKTFVNGNVNKEFWIGGQRRESDGAWVWSSLNDASSTSNNYIQVPNQIIWDAGKPDDTSGDCLEMGKNASFSNQNCNDPKPYICKRPIGIPTNCDIDDNWEPVNGTCIKVFKTNLNYDSSRAVCQAEGGDLAVVKSDSIQIFLSDWYKINKKPLWLGLSDKNKNDSFLHWVDDHYSIPFQYWAPGQPLFIKSNDSTIGNCTVINDLLNGFWSIDRCTNQYYFACQKTPGQCPDNWIPFKNECYLINSERQKYTSWFDAKTTCSTYGGNLVTIHDKFEQFFIQRQIKNSFSTTDFWLGLSDLKPVQNKYTWVLGYEVVNYTNWLTNQPVSDQTRDNCGAISILQGNWYVTSNCYQNLPYICEIELDEPVIPNPSNIFTYGGNSDNKPCVFPFIYKQNVYYQCINNDRDNYWCGTTSNYDIDLKWGYCQYPKTCDIGWTETDNNCFKLFENSTTFQESNDICASQNGQLATIKNPKVQTTINKLLNFGNGSWFGLKNSPTTQNWGWTDGSNLNQNDFNNWRFKHPNSSSGKECAILDNSELYLGEWMSIDCNFKLNSFVCQKQSLGTVIPPITPQPTTTPSAKCGQNFVERPFSNFCYHFSTKIETFSKSDQDCQQLGGSLVSITSVDEQLFVQNYISSSNVNQKTFWLGANRESASKGWSWIDKQYPFIFTNWAEGEYNTGNNQFCAVIVNDLNGQWKTIECDNSLNNIKFNYICKKFNLNATQPSSTSFPTQSGVNYGCEEGWSKSKTNCYKYFNTINDHKSFDDAKSSCKSLRSDMVEVFSEEENQFVVSLIQMRKNDLENKNMKSYGCPSGWTYNSIKESCYQLVTTGTNDWNKAQSFCNKNGAYLASIKSQNEQNFIANLTNEEIWIGLKRKSGSIVWEFSDNTVALGQYSNWDINFPTGLTQVDRCAVMYRSNLFNKWYDLDCVNSRTLKFVCEKEATVQDACTQYFSPTTGGGGNCIHKDQCANNFFVSNLCGEYNDPDLECCLDLDRSRESVWLGMYDELSGFNQVSFKWLSGAPPTYTNWAPNEPNSNAQCVSMHIRDSALGPFQAGQWQVTSCNYRNGYFCKKPIQPIILVPTTQTLGCQAGFKNFENKCFYLELSEKTFQEAENNCNQLNSNLVSITDRFEQFWINNEFSSQYSATKWIGLSDLNRPGNYQWNNNDTFSFSNWDRNMPDQTKGRCVGMKSNGFWSNYDCNLKQPSVCMNFNTYFTTPTKPTTPKPIPCPSGWSEADGKCHKLFGPKNLQDKKTWFEADLYCKSLNGHLSSFKTYDSLSRVTSGQNIFSYGNDYSFWIGLNKLDRDKGYQWSDGTGASYFNWDFNQPDDLNGVENCVELRYTGRWRDNFCYSNKGWSCSIEKGIDPNNTSDFVDDVFKIVECPNNTNYNWTLYNGKCYYVSSGINEEKANWFKAREFCKQIGGELLSMHSRKELDYVNTIAGKKLERWWIGLYASSSGGFLWSDGSPLNHLNWNAGEPNDAHGGEKCVEMYSSNSFWNDANCGLNNGFICEKTNRTQTQEIVLPLSFNNGNSESCPPGYSTFGVITTDNFGMSSPCVFPFKYKGNFYYECVTFEDRSPWCATTSDYDQDLRWGYCTEIKCFRLVSDRKVFSEARKVCAADSASLASVHNELEQSYLTALLRNKTNNDHWIGLWAPSESFYYEDNSILDYSKWAPNKPGNTLGNDRCVVMSGNIKTPGLWQNVNCNGLYNFICSKYANGVKYVSGCESSNLTSFSQNVSLTCPTGLKIAIIKADFGRDLYSLTCDDKYHVGQECTSRIATTEKVRQLCQEKENCSLTTSVSFFDDPCPNVIKQLRVWYQCVNLPVYTVDGNSNGKPCTFPFKYKNISHYQCTYESRPLSGPNDVIKKWCCTTNNCDSSFNYGNCPESNPPLISNFCTKPGYISVDNGKNCYQLYQSRKTWNEAKNYCEQTDGAKLVTITDGFEQSFIFLFSYVKTQSDPWIGFQINSNMWSDSWPVTYTNFGSTGSVSSTTNSCAFIQSKDGFWNTTSCNDQRAFVCKITQERVPMTTEPSSGYCPDSWDGFGPYCYKLDPTSRSYGDAKFDCNQKGAFISSILNQEELEFINVLNSLPNLPSNPLWIGLEKNQISGSYQWQDGSSVVFTSYAPNFMNNQPCVYMSNSLWYDSECFLARRKYVCKRPRIVTTESSTTVLSTTTTTTETTKKSTIISSTISNLISSSAKFTSSSAATSTQFIPDSSSTTSENFSTSTLSQQKSTSTQDKPVTFEQTKNKKMNGGAVFGILFAVILGVVIAACLTLVILKKKAIINIQLPILDSIFFKNYSTNETYFSNSSQTVKMLSGIQNPVYN